MPQVTRTIRREADGLGALATGHPSGEVYIWRHRCAVRVLRPSRCTPPTRPRSDGNPWVTLTSCCGVRCLRCWTQPDESAAGAEETPAVGMHVHGATVWFLAAASQHGAVHVWKLLEDSGGRKRGGGACRAACDPGAGERRAGRLVSVWVPRRPQVASRSAVRAFDVAPGARGGLRIAVGTFDGSLWLCQLPSFPAVAAEVRRLRAHMHALPVAWHMSS